MNKIEKAISAINTAKDIYQGLTAGVSEMQNAEIRGKFIELKSALLDSQEQVLNVKEEMQEQQNEIARLKEAFSIKEKLVLKDHYGQYYRVNEHGEAHGSPYCSRCWEVDQKAISVSRKRNCPECNAQLWRTIPLTPNKEEGSAGT